VDSDGLKGVYNIEKVDGVLQIHVNAKTQSQNTIEYIYNIESLGASNMILYSKVGSVTNKFYYNTNH
jgi:purine nucleoside phosphorylase